MNNQEITNNNNIIFLMGKVVSITVMLNMIKTNKCRNQNSQFIPINNNKNKEIISYNINCFNEID